MVARVSGALAAIAAAALLIAGVVTSAWWTGHGDKGGGTDVSIGLRQAQRCYVRHEANGKPRCTATTTTDCDSSEEYHCDTKGTTAVSTAFGAMGWGATVLGALAAIVLAIAGGIAFARGRREAKGAAEAGATIAMIAGAAGVAFVLMRPALKDFDVELAWSAYAFLGGSAAAVAAAALLRREERTVVHAHAPAGPVRVAPAMQVDVAAMFDEEARQASARSAAAALASLDEPAVAPEPPSLSALGLGDKTDPDAKAPVPPPLVPAVRVASETRADTEKDLPPDDMQGTPAPKPAPPPVAAPPPVRPKPSSLPPLPLPRTKPPSLPPPVRPPATPSGTGPAPRIAAPEPSIAPKAAPPPTTTSAAGPVPACPQCDAPTIWNEEHLRFFCRSCRIYL